MNTNKRKGGKRYTPVQKQRMSAKMKVVIASSTLTLLVFAFLVYFNLNKPQTSMAATGEYVMPTVVHLHDMAVPQPIIDPEITAARRQGSTVTCKRKVIATQ